MPQHVTVWDHYSILHIEAQHKQCHVEWISLDNLTSNDRPIVEGVVESGSICISMNEISFKWRCVSSFDILLMQIEILSDGYNQLWFS